MSISGVKAIDFRIDFDTVDGEKALKRFNDALNGLHGNSGKAGSGVTGLWKQIAGGAIIVSTVHKAMVAFQNAVEGAFEKTSVFEVSMKKVSTMVDTSAVSMAGLTDEVLNMAGELGSAEELSRGLYQALSAGIKPAKALEFVGTAAKFAKAGLIEVDEAVDVLSTAIQSYNLDASQATRMGDVMFETYKRAKVEIKDLASSLGNVLGVASSVGVSFEELNAALVPLAQGGIRTSEAVTSLKAVLSNIAKPAKEAEETAKALGINFSIAGLQSKGFAGFLRELTEKTKGNIQAQADLFGSVEAFNAITKLTSEQGIKTFNEALDGMLHSQGNVEEAFEKMMESFTEVKKAIKNEIEAVLIKELLPQLEKFKNWLKENKEQIVEWTKKGIELAVAAIEALGKAIVFVLDHKTEVAVFGGAIATAFAVNTVAKWGKAVSSALNIIKAHPAMAALAAIGTAATWISEKVAADADASWTKALNDMSAIDGFKQKISAVYQASSAEMQKLIDSEIAKIRDYDRRRREILGSSPLTDAIREEWNKTDRQLYENLNGMLEKCGTAGKKAGEEISEAGEKIVEAGEGGTKTLQAATKEIDNERKAIKSLLNDFYGIKESILEQIEAHRKNAQAIGLGADEMERLAAAAMDARFRQTYESMPVIAEETKLKIYDMVPGVQRTYDATTQLQGMSMKTVDTWADLNAKAEMFGRTGQSLISLLDTLGIKSGAIGEAFSSGISGISSGLSMLSGAKNETNPLLGFLGKASGWISIASAGISFLSSIGEALFGGDGMDDAFDRMERKGISVSDTLQEEIKALRDAGMDGGVAIAKMTDKIIEEGEVTAENLSGYADLIKDIYMQIDNGRLTGTEAVNEVSDAFLALAEKAEIAGQAGSKALTDLLNDARNRGLVSDDMMEWIDSARQTGIDALIGHFSGTITNQKTYNQALWQTQAIFKGMQLDGKSMIEIVQAMGPALDELLRIGEDQGYTDQDGLLSQLFGFKEFYSENEALLQHLQSTQTVMDSMAKTGILTADQFSGFQTNLQQYYDQLKAAGATEDERLQAILPMLAKQAWYAEQYGWTLDENTRKLIEQAKEHGYNLEAGIPAEEKMLALQERMVTALEKMAGIYQRMDGDIDSMTSSMDKYRYSIESAASAAGMINFASSGKGEIPAYASGTHGAWVMQDSLWRMGDGGEPEMVNWDGVGRVKITPASQMQLRSPAASSVIVRETRVGTMRVSLELPNVTDKNSVKELKSALETNQYGIRDSLHRALGTRNH